MHFFNMIGRQLLDIERGDSLKEDKFAYDR